MSKFAIANDGGHDIVGDAENCKADACPCKAGCIKPLYHGSCCRRIYTVECIWN